MVGAVSDGASMYDGFAEEYLAHASEGAFNAQYDRPAVLEVLGSVHGLSVLDVGCGPGLYAEEFVARGASRVVGVDGSAEMLRLARQRLAGPAGRVVFHCQDLQVPLAWAGDGEFEPRPSAAMHERYPDDAANLSINPGFVVFALLKR